MATVPSLSSAFSNLLGGLFSAPKAPAAPNTSSYTSVGVSSPSALASAGKLPATPNMSVYNPATAPRLYTPSTPAQIAATNAANPHTGANASYVNPANATASKGTVPYVPAGPNGGGMSVVPTFTSATTKLPSAPGAISPASSAGYTPPALPALPKTNATPSISSNSSNQNSTPATPSFDAASVASPATPNGPAASPDFSGSGSGFGISGGANSPTYSPSTGGFTQGGLSTPGMQPYAWDNVNGGGSSPTDPYGLSLFSSTEQEKAQKAYEDALQMTPEEVAANKQLNDLITSEKTAYTNAQGQAIPLPFITGQQKNIQESAANLASPLESALTLMQGQRQLRGTAAQTALTQANDRLAAVRDFLKPVPTSYGGTLSQFDPTTGTYKTLVNPFGTATGTATGSDPANVTDVIGSAIANGQLSQDMVTRYGIPFIAATLKADPGYNFITQKASVGADSASLKTQQAYVDTVTRSFNTANANLNSLQGFMQQYGLNQSSVPLINQLTNKVKAAGADPGSVAAFQAALSGLRAEYAQVLSRGGEVTDSSRATAASLIPDNISPSQLAEVAQRLNTEGQNAIQEATTQVSKIKSRVGSNAGSSTNFGTGGNSANPFSAQNFFGT